MLRKNRRSSTISSVIILVWSCSEDIIGKEKITIIYIKIINNRGV